MNHRHLVVVLVGALALVGAGATAWANRTPAPLPPLAVETLAPVEAFTDWQRRRPEDAQVGGDLVIEHSALGAAVRKDLAMTSGVTLTQWAVEHDGYLYLVEWMHHPDDDTDRPTVEAMIASWRWS